MNHKVSELYPFFLQAVENNIFPITGRCNLSCLFCSHAQNPRRVRAYSFAPLSLDAAEELMSFLESGKKIVMGESSSRLREGEPLTHPHIKEILQKIRSKFPRTPIQITTNGSYLDNNFLSFLEELHPLELVISLNSSSPENRAYLMRDPSPEVSIKALSKLTKRNIPFHGSVVAMPHLVGWSDLAQTIKYLDRCGASTIRVFLPGYTRYADVEISFTQEFFIDIRQKLQELQASIAAPLLPEPPGIEDLTPRVAGVIPGSPAHHKKIKPGEVVREVSGHSPRTRVEAHQLITRMKDPTLIIQKALKDGEQTENQVSIKKEPNTPSGLVFFRDLAPEEVAEVKRRGSDNGNLLMTSYLAFPWWEKARKIFKLPPIKILPVRCRFWGGSIASAGLLTVEDFLFEALELSAAETFERVFLPPQAFDRSGQDLLGRSYLELYRAFPAKTEIIV